MRRNIDSDKQKESNSGSAKESHQLSKDGMEKKNEEILHRTGEITLHGEEMN